MKFKVRFADQIVGLFIILSLVSLVFVIVMLGRSQRWFTKDVSFATLLPSAGGLSKNMAVQYKGFTIGNVKSFYLTENDNVIVTFIIFEEYRDRVRLGSMVEVAESPVGLGNKFQFYTGNGEILDEGSLLPTVGSAQAREFVRQGLAAEPKAEDSITAIMNKVNAILDDVNLITTEIGEALGVGSSETEIGKIIGSLQNTMTGAEGIPYSITRTINEIRSDLGPILENVNTMITELNNPDGLVYTILDTDKDVYTNLVKSLTSVSAILDNLEKTTEFIPAQLPQVAGLIMDLRVTMKTAEDLMTALTNNPLLKGGVPGRLETEDNNTSPRNIRF